MRKQSMMGSSRFEFAPRLLQERHEQRIDAYTSAYADVLAAIEQSLAKYADGDIVTRESLQEWMGEQLVREFIRRRG